MLRATLRQQAIIGFLAVKIALGMAAFIMLTVGVPVELQHHQSDALPNLFLGLIWLPSVEFLPTVTPHQKYVTLARLVLPFRVSISGSAAGTGIEDNRPNQSMQRTAGLPPVRRYPQTNSTHHAPSRSFLLFISHLKPQPRRGSMESAGGTTEISPGQRRTAPAAPGTHHKKTHPSFSDAVGHAVAF